MISWQQAMASRTSFGSPSSIISEQANRVQIELLMPLHHPQHARASITATALHRFLLPTALLPLNLQETDRFIVPKPFPVSLTLFYRTQTLPRATYLNISSAKIF